MAEALLAALRDASWHYTPGTAWKYHVIVDEYAACSRPRSDGWPRMTLAEFTERFAVDVPDGLRCQRPGCRQRWPEPAAARPARDGGEPK